MSQAPASVAPQPAKATAVPAQFLTLAVGGLAGSSYQLYPGYSAYGTSPSNITTLPGYKQRFAGATLGAAFTQRLGADHTNQLTVGVNGFIGRTSFVPLVFTLNSYSGYDSTYATEVATHRPLYDINPYVEYFTPGLGRRPLHLRVGLGVHLSSSVAYDNVTEPLSRQSFGTLSLLGEIGYSRILWLHTSLLNGADAVGNGVLRFGLGTGLGGDQVTLLGGLASTNSNGQNKLRLVDFGGPGYYAPFSGFLQARWQATPAWQVEGGALGNFNDVTQFSLGARYRLPLAAR
jgi:hypothetical protein